MGNALKKRRDSKRASEGGSSKRDSAGGKRDSAAGKGGAADEAKTPADAPTQASAQASAASSRKSSVKGNSGVTEPVQRKSSVANSKGGASGDSSALTADPGEGDAEIRKDGPVGELKATTDSNMEAQVDSYKFWDRDKTFKPQKDLPKGGKRESKYNTIGATMQATLGGGDLAEAVKLPEGEDLNEWIGINTIRFYNMANLIYGECLQFCTPERCPTMSAGRNEYLWKDGVNFKKPTVMAAPVYIDNLMLWVHEQISDPKLFPVEDDVKFPPKFLSKVKVIYKRLFRLYAHLYWSHFEELRSIGASTHLNTCFKSFVYFILEFDLVDKKGLEPLENFIAKFREKDANRRASGLLK